MLLRWNSKIWLVPILCGFAAIIGGFSGILHWGFVVAYFMLNVIYIGFIASSAVRIERNTCEREEFIPKEMKSFVLHKVEPPEYSNKDVRKSLLDAPAWTFLFYALLVLWPWGIRPIACVDFSQLGPGDRPAALILRACLCLGAFLFTTYLTQLIISDRVKTFCYEYGVMGYVKAALIGFITGLFILVIVLNMLALNK